MQHSKVLEKHPSRITVSYEGKQVAQSDDAYILVEMGPRTYDPVFYFPKSDINKDLVARDNQRGNTHCPFKGEAIYWNYTPQPTQNYFAWSYEHPLSGSEKIAGYLAFNHNLVTFKLEPKS